MRFLISALTLVSFLQVAGQEGAENEWKEASKESQAYHDYRVKPTTPPYGLQKIKSLVAKTRINEEEVKAINKKTYDALSLREKFTYTMIHAENFSQNCDAMPPIQEEHRKIFAQLPDAFDEYSWSKRQTDFLKANRDSVMSLIRESYSRTKRIGVNLKHAIVEINGKEMIPFIITSYREIKKDLDLLTVLMLLMKENNYDPFIKSASHRKLYSEDSYYLSYLDYNKANEELIIKRATEFYNAGK